MLFQDKKKKKNHKQAKLHIKIYTIMGSWVGLFAALKIDQVFSR